MDLCLKKLASQIILIVLVVVFLFLCPFPLVQASNCPTTDYDCQLAEIQREIDALTPAHEHNKKELANLNNQIANLKKRIAGISTELNKLTSDIAQREEDLAYVREIFNQKASNHYKFIRTYDPIAPFFLSNASQAFQSLSFRQRAADEDRKVMEQYAQDLLNLKNDKEALEKTKQSLATTQAKLDSQAKFLGGEVAKVESYIAELSAKQQELLAG